MSEGSSYIENADVVKVDNVSRLPRPEGGLPPLMEDVRATNLAYAELPESHGQVFLKAVGAPYTGEHGVHLLAIPDAPDKSNIPGVKDISAKDLGSTLQFASAFADKTLAQPDIEEVDLGWHHSRAELTNIPKQRQATFPKNLHIHILGFSDKDKKVIDPHDTLHTPDLKGKIGDEQPIYQLGEEILVHEVLEPLRVENPTFDQIFEETRDKRGRLSFKMKAGKAGFTNPELPGILQTLDAKAKDQYDKIGANFFVPDEEGGFKVKPKTDENPYERYELLPEEKRRENVEEYIKDRPWLSEKVQYSLRYLAGQAKDETEIVERELEKAKTAKGAELTPNEVQSYTAQAANRFWAYKDLTYSMVWSAKKTEKDTTEPEWVFRMDPSVFTTEGIVKSSANTSKIITKGTDHYTQEQLTAVQARERAIISAVQQDHPTYKTGPGIELNA